METILEMLSKFDLTTIIGIFIISWYHTHELRKEIKEETRVIAERTDKLYEMFIDLLKDKKS